MLFIQNTVNMFRCGMSYRIEIELPNSGVWFKYFRIIDSLKEAKSIRKVAEGKIKTRIRKNV
jgi:hypothetical protein